MTRHGRSLALAIALIAGAAPAHGQAIDPAPTSAGGGESGRAGVSALRDAGVLCVFDPAERRKLREVTILTEPATGDTFAALEPDARPLPLGLLYSPRRNYVGSRAWFGADAPLTFAGRTYQRQGAPVVLPIRDVRPAGTTADVWLFERTSTDEPDVLYVPSGPGCQFQPYGAVSPAVRGGRASWGVPPRHVRLGYMTDRMPTGDARPGRHFDVEQGSLTPGVADITVTARHRVGKLESRWLLGGGTDTLSHIVLFRLEAPASQRTGSRALLYIHGYLNTFEDAARRAAQLAEDLDFDGDVYFFSWPSRASIMGYLADETAIQRARPDIEAAITELIKAYRPGNVSVIAHSMGNRGFAQAVHNLVPAHPGKLFDQVVLASPDQDLVVFRNDDIGPIVAASNRVTVYTSASDRALLASRKLHIGARAGDDPEPLGTVAGIDVVDTSGGTGGILGHSDYAESPVVLGDLFLLLRGRTPAQRALVPVQKGPSTYWTFR